MVTIYLETRTVHVRMPVISLGRWSGALIVRLQDRCEEHLDTIAQLRAAHRARRNARLRRYDAAVRRAEAHQYEAISLLQGRGL